MGCSASTASEPVRRNGDKSTSSGEEDDATQSSFSRVIIPMPNPRPRHNFSPDGSAGSHPMTSAFITSAAAVIHRATAQHANAMCNSFVGENPLQRRDSKHDSDDDADVEGSASAVCAQGAPSADVLGCGITTSPCVQIAVDVPPKAYQCQSQGSSTARFDCPSAGLFELLPYSSSTEASTAGFGSSLPRPAQHAGSSTWSSSATGAEIFAAFSHA